MSAKSILIIEDDPVLLRGLKDNFEAQGYLVRTARDGQKGMDALMTAPPDLLLLDLMLPKVNGYEICRQARSRRLSTPILMLSAKCREDDVVRGFELGADDYMTKPFNPRELVARVKAILRRSEPKNMDAAAPPVVHIGDLVIDTARREVSSAGKIIDLRTQEFEVLLVLARHKGLVLTREQLLSLAWGFDFYGQTRTVDVHIAQIRRKLGSSSVTIETVTGIGYKLVG